MSRDLCDGICRDKTDSVLKLLENPNILKYINQPLNPDTKKLQGIGGYDKFITGKSALFLAAFRNNLLLVRKLLGIPGIDINAKGEEDLRTVLHAAAVRGNGELGALLIEAGATLSPDHKGRTPIHVAALSGNIDFLQWLLEHDISLINSRASNGFTLLDAAILFGNKGVKADDFMMFGQDDPERSKKLVNLLLKSGAQITPGINSYTPFHLAAISGNIDLLDILLQHGNQLVNHKANGGVTALHFAILCGNEEHDFGTFIMFNKEDPERNLKLVTMLLKHGADITPEYHTITPIHLASQYGHTSILEMLLKQDSSLVNLKSSFGLTALHDAATSGHLDCVEVLLRYGASVMATNKENQTASEVASQEGFEEVSRFLTENQQGQSSEELHEKLEALTDTCAKLKSENTTLKTQHVVQKVHLLHLDTETKKLKYEHDAHKVEMMKLEDKVASLGEMSEWFSQHPKGMGQRDRQAKAKKFQEIFRKNMSYLKENIWAADHLDYLYEKYALDDRDMEIIRSKPGPRTQTDELLYLLQAKPDPDKWVFAFLESLEKVQATTHLMALFN